MRRRDIRAARKESVAQDWSAFAVRGERDEFDYQSPRVYIEADTADSYQRDAIDGATSGTDGHNRRDDL